MKKTSKSKTFEKPVEKPDFDATFSGMLELIEDNELREFYTDVLTEYCNELVRPLQARIAELEEHLSSIRHAMYARDIDEDMLCMRCGCITPSTKLI